jgi:hypothetical protein
MFRPGSIQPMNGVRSRTAWYQAVYNVIAPLYPVLQRVIPANTTVEMGSAMIEVAEHGYPRPILLPRDITAAATPR